MTAPLSSSNGKRDRSNKTVAQFFHFSHKNGHFLVEKSVLDTIRAFPVIHEYFPEVNYELFRQLFEIVTFIYLILHVTVMPVGRVGDFTQCFDSFMVSCVADK